MTKARRARPADIVSRLRPQRIAVEETDDGLVIHNPARRAWLMALILIGLLAIWSMGEAFGIRELVRGPFVVTISMIVWLLIWSTADVCVSLVVLWTLFGSERLFIVHDAVLHEPGVGPFRFKRQWTPGDATDFHLTRVRAAWARRAAGSHSMRAARTGGSASA